MNKNSWEKRGGGVLFSQLVAHCRIRCDRMVHDKHHPDLVAHKLDSDTLLGVFSLINHKIKVPSRPDVPIILMQARRCELWVLIGEVIIGIRVAAQGDDVCAAAAADLGGGGACGRWPKSEIRRVGVLERQNQTRRGTVRKVRFAQGVKFRSLIMELTVCHICDARR